MFKAVVDRVTMASGGASPVFLTGHRQGISPIGKGNQNIVVHAAYEQRFMRSDVSNAFYYIKVQNIFYST